MKILVATGPSYAFRSQCQAAKLDGIRAKRSGRQAVICAMPSSGGCAMIRRSATLARIPPKVNSSPTAFGVTVFHGRDSYRHGQLDRPRFRGGLVSCVIRLTVSFAPTAGVQPSDARGVCLPSVQRDLHAKNGKRCEWPAKTC